MNLKNTISKKITLASLVFSLSSLVLFAACTDYQEEFENAFGALEYTHESSDSTPDGSSDSGSGKSSSSIKEKSSSSVESSSAKEPSSNSEKSSSSVKVSSSSTDKLSSAKESSSSAKSSSSVTDASSSSVKSSSSMGDSGEYTDVRNNYVYKYITHNGLKWMTENLKYPSDGRGLCYATVLGNCDRYGRLYTWNDAKDACPDEWRLPTKSEMEAYFKNPYPDLFEKIGYGGMGSNWGGYWRWDDNTGVNHSGAHGKDSVGYYWTGTNDNGKSYYFKLSADDPVFAYWEDDNLYSYVRCVWGKESTSVNVGSSSSAQSSSAIASSSSVAASSSSVSSSSSSVALATPCKDNSECLGSVKIGEDSYKTVKIGTQWWMASNVKFETSEGSFCYDNDPENCEAYSILGVGGNGRLYTWNAAKKVCPSGWHLPTKEDFETLIAAVGGEANAGHKLKSPKGWTKGYGENKYGFDALPTGYLYDGNGIKSSSTDFNYLDGEYETTCFWSATPDPMERGNVHMLVLNNQEKSASIGSQHKESFAFSVRCVKDSE